MILLGLDLETTTFDTEILRITEVGAVLYDTEYNCPIEIQADLVYEPDISFPLDPYVVELTGITESMIKQYGKHPYEVIQKFLGLYKRADYIVAHNGNSFDQPAMKLFLERYLDEPKLKENILMNDLTPKPRPWLDTMTDIPYPELINTRKLQDLCGRHGFLNPFPHRAFTDVMAMLKILSMYNLDEVIEISKSPELTFNANVDYHSKDVAKAAKFHWDSGLRKWQFKMKEYFMDKEKYESGTLWDFPYSEVKND